MRDRTVYMYLIWETKQYKGMYHIKRFPNIQLLNKYLASLDPDGVLEVKVVSGLELENRTSSG